MVWACLFVPSLSIEPGKMGKGGFGKEVSVVFCVTAYAAQRLENNEIVLLTPFLLPRLKY